LPPFQPFYFTCVRDHEEDFVTVEYLRDVALQSGLDGRHIFIEDIGFDAERQCFCDLDNNPITHAFKLYPWEWLLADEFGENVMTSGIRFFEPPWKMILANKGISPSSGRWRRATGTCYRLFRGRQDLWRLCAEAALFAGGSQRNAAGRWQDVRRRRRELRHRRICVSEGTAAAELQRQLCGGGFMGGQRLPAGLGIREDSTPITTNTSLFVPHYFQP
jgi:hypothetical protein